MNLFRIPFLIFIILYAIIPSYDIIKKLGFKIQISHWHTFLWQGLRERKGDHNVLRERRSEIQDGERQLRNSCRHSRLRVTSAITLRSTETLFLLLTT